ncbi:putative transposase, Ptta/En/Spm, plant [Sesbania bispinosa]|nr:putative transposase, Ptta/En/Spm, plant [Sesbania bispinosa]
MPKVKHFRNPQRSAPQPQHDVSPQIPAPAYSSPTMNPNEPSPSVEAPSNVSPPIESSPTHEISQEEIPQEGPTSRHVNRESPQYWNVDAIGVTKKIKIKVREVKNLPSGESIIVEFDDQGQAYGEAQGLLAGFCGILATDCNLFPINFERWSGKTGMPKCYFDDCYATILKLLETGQNPSRGKMYIATHKRKDGSYVNDEAKEIGEQIEVGLTQSIVDESEVSPNDIVGRVFGAEHSGRVRCMGMGAAPTNTFRNTRLRLSDLSISSSNAGTSSSCSNACKEKYTNLESQLQGTLNALKAYMIMKEGKIPDELVGFFASQPSDAGK